MMIPVICHVGLSCDLSFSTNIISVLLTVSKTLSMAAIMNFITDSAATGDSNTVPNAHNIVWMYVELGNSKKISSIEI